MKYIKIRKDEAWVDGDVLTLKSGDTQWRPSKPELLYPNLKEWFIHNIMRKHFTFGQPYCVVCGYSEDKS